jgi:large subunit ribosomal protein L25
MKLEVKTRGAAKKSEIKAIRRAGNIPAVLYVRGKEGETISIPGAEFTSLLRKVQSGRLSTTVFELGFENGVSRRAILKDIQYDPTSYKVIHLDFEELVEETKINVKVPIECVGIVDCVGMKLGGVLRQVIRHLRVRCLPQDVPAVFQIDIRNMALNDVKRLKDLDIPETVRPLINLNEVAIVIAKR